MAGMPWLAALCVAGAVVVTGCGGPTSIPIEAPPPHGVLSGVAEECTGPINLPDKPVQVVVSRDHHVVVEQTKLGSHGFTFSLPAGKYLVTSNQSYVVPVKVTLQAGRVAHVSVRADCS